MERVHPPETARALVRLNALWLGLTFATVAGIGLFVATLVLALRGGEAVGSFLGQLRYLFPMYTVTVGGAFIGGLWAAFSGMCLGLIMGFAYGPWLLDGATRQMRGGAEGERDRVVHSIMLLDPMPFALVSGALLGFGLFSVTNWLWFTTGEWSPHLFLLHNYMPGYEPTFSGSLIGGAWLFLYGGLAAFAVAWIYDRLVKARFPAEESA